MGPEHNTNTVKNSAYTNQILLSLRQESLFLIQVNVPVTHRREIGVDFEDALLGDLLGDGARDALCGVQESLLRAKALLHVPPEQTLYNSVHRTEENS